MSTGHRAPTGLTVDQERFAHLLLSGYSQSDAYREVWPRSRRWKPESVHTAASRMAAKVAPRCAVLLELELTGARLTIEQTIEDLHQARELAMEKGDAAGAVRMTGALARLCGFLRRAGKRHRLDDTRAFDPASLLAAVQGKMNPSEPVADSLQSRQPAAPEALRWRVRFPLYHP
ncbi:MAG: hypothetical protein TEF_21295 [Rhizobiales bacterium NRL2]|nr:MAG: hypothetical protein TEF_21295 [Rhizobiales bacterium NRL2]